MCSFPTRKVKAENKLSLPSDSSGSRGQDPFRPGRPKKPDASPSKVGALCCLPSRRGAPKGGSHDSASAESALFRALSLLRRLAACFPTPAAENLFMRLGFGTCKPSVHIHTLPLSGGDGWRRGGSGAGKWPLCATPPRSLGSRSGLAPRPGPPRHSRVRVTPEVGRRPRRRRRRARRGVRSLSVPALLGL